jgi:hypothetical protein
MTWSHDCAFGGPGVFLGVGRGFGSQHQGHSPESPRQVEIGKAPQEFGLGFYPGPFVLFQFAVAGVGEHQVGFVHHAVEGSPPLAVAVGLEESRQFGRTAALFHFLQNEVGNGQPLLPAGFVVLHVVVGRVDYADEVVGRFPEAQVGDAAVFGRYIQKDSLQERLTPTRAGAAIFLCTEVS